jgi:peptidyl-prolyl cis-trans isomerase C
MKLRIVVAAALAAPLLVLAQAADPDAAKGTKAAKPATKAASKGGTAARVNGVAVPSSRIDFMVKQQVARGAPDNEQTRTMVREELVNREIVAQEAAKNGVAKSAEVQSQLDVARQDIIVSAYVRDWLRKNPVTDAEIQKEYDKARGQTGDKEYKARHILVEGEDLAKDLIAQLKKGAKFEELAAKNSKDTGSKERGGDLDWNVPSMYDKQFSDAMVKLEKGKYTEAPVQTRFGYHVIQLDDVRALKFPSLAEVKPKIQQQLVQNKIEEMVRSLRAKAKVE